MPNRREFLLTTAAAGMGYWVAGGVQAKESRSPNRTHRLRQHRHRRQGAERFGRRRPRRRHGGHLRRRRRQAGQAGQHRFKKAKKFNDFRKMLDEMGKSIDAVTVSTPDHIHALAAAMAMKMRKHCFVQKPLTHSIHEARVLGQLAREKEVATQMGNQGTANDGLRKAAAAVQAGVLGTVKEVHVWTNRPIWPQGGDRARAGRAAQEPALGPLARPGPGAALWQRLSSVQLARLVGFRHAAPWATWPATPSTCPSWRLNLRDPISVQAETSGHNKDSYPKWSVIAFEFPATRQAAGRQGLLVRRRQASARRAVRRPQRRTAPARLLVGEKGKLFAPATIATNFELHRRRRQCRRSNSSIRRATSRNGSARSRAASRPCRTSPTTPARSPRRSCWATWPCGLPPPARARRSSGTPRI